MRKLQTKTTWRKVKLGEVLELKYGFGLPEKKRSSGNVSVFGSSGIVGMHDKPAVKSHGIVVGRKGNVGSVYYSERPFYPIDTVYYVDELKIPGDLKFFYYFLQRIPFKRIGSDVGVPGLNRDIAYGLEVKIPENPAYQKRIAEILSVFDDKIELNNKISAALEQTAQAIFKEWFVKSEKLKVKSEKLFNLGKIICGKTPSKLNPEYFGGKIPFIKIPDMHNQMFILKTKDSLTEAGVNSQKTRFIPKNSICVSCIATVGLVSITTEDSQTNQQINTIIPKTEKYLEFLYLALKMIKNDLMLIGSGGSTTLNINTSIFSNIEILVPEGEIINKFHKLANPIFNKILQVNRENQKLAALRDLLLPKLMSEDILVKS